MEREGVVREPGPVADPYTELARRLGVLPSNVPIVFDERSGTRLHVDTPDDVDKNNEEFELRMSLLSQSVFEHDSLQRCRANPGLSVSAHKALLEFPRLARIRLQTNRPGRAQREVALGLVPRRVHSLAVQTAVSADAAGKVWK